MSECIVPIRQNSTILHKLISIVKMDINLFLLLYYRYALLYE